MLCCLNIVSPPQLLQWLSWLSPYALPAWKLLLFDQVLPYVALAVKFRAAEDIAEARAKGRIREQKHLLVDNEEIVRGLRFYLNVQSHVHKPVYYASLFSARESNSGRVQPWPCLLKYSFYFVNFFLFLRISNENFDGKYYFISLFFTMFFNYSHISALITLVIITATLSWK